MCQGIGVALHLFMMLSFAWLVGKSLSLLWTVFFDVDNNGWFNRHGGKVMVLLCWGDFLLVGICFYSVLMVVFVFFSKAYLLYMLVYWDTSTFQIMAASHCMIVSF